MSKAIVTVGLGFGDEGKGGIVDWLVRRHDADIVVRYNGGAQAAHHVVAPDGREHTFAQFGSGTFVPGVRTHLSRHVVVNPLNLFRENDVLCSIGVTDALPRLTIDMGALIVTPWHIAVNRAREAARGWNRHGSCGQGIGEARADELTQQPCLRAGHLGSVAYTTRRLTEIRDLKRVELAELDPTDDWLHQPMFADPKTPERLAAQYHLLATNIVVEDWLPPKPRPQTVIFEGAQGVLLDERYGFAPHNSWTDTTAANAYELLDAWGIEPEARRTLGVMRAYMTRHGHGPLPTVSVRLTDRLTEKTNGTSAWQGPFRVGYPDWVLLDYALRCAPVDALAVTCIDRIHSDALQAEWRACTHYEVGGRKLFDLKDHTLTGSSTLPGKVLERAWPNLVPMGRTERAYRQALPAPVDVFSYGPRASDKVEPSD